MTEYEKLLQAVSSAEPEYLKFSQWSADKQITDSVDGRLQYADYLRKVHIDAGAATADTEKQIQQGLYSALVSDGSLEQGDYEGFQQLTAPKDIPFETKVSLVQSHLGTDDPDWETIAEYNTVRGEVDPEDEEFKDLQQRAEEAMDRKYDVVKRKLLRSKQLPFIATTDEDGNRTILASDAALNMSFSDALQASQAGGVSLADAYLAKTQLEPVAGTNLPRFKFNRIHEAKAVISKMSELTPDITTQIAGHSRNLSESEDSGFLDWSARKVNALGDEIMSFFSDEAEKQLEALEKAQDITKESAVKTLTDKLNNYSDLPDGEEYSYDEVAAAYDIAVLEHGTYNDEFEVYEGEEAGKNLRMTSSGIPVIHPAVIANENAFNDMVKARPDVSPEILDQIRSQRSAILDSNFSQYSQLLGRSAVEDEWNEALMVGRAKGLKNHEILNDFLKDEDNYSMIAARASGLWWSFAEGLGTLLAAVPAALGSETAQDYLVGASQLAADRREVAELFGKGYGVIGEAFESIAPMTVDLVATGLLATASAPAGGALGAAYVTARAGSIAGIKALTKGVASNVIKTAPKLIGKGKSALPLKEVIETSLKTVDGQLANKALKGYNSALAQKIGVTSALFVPAATRSGAASYGSITNALRQTTDLSNEEIHNRAVGAALLSGTVTGLVTSGFSLLGRGGIDDALLRGMSFKEFKSVLGSVSDFAENFSDKKVKDVLIATVNKAKDKLGPMAGIKPFTKGLSDEALEEGLDQFLNSFVEDAALDQNTPLLERLQQTFHAAVIGGMIGAGVPVVQKLGERFRVNSDLRQQQQRDIRMNLFQEAAKNLRETGSPAFAQVFEAQFAASARSLKGPLTLPDREKQSVPEQTKGTVLEGKSMKEIEQLAQIANSAGETDVVTEEQLAASQFLQEINEETQAQKVDFTEQAQVDEQTKGTVLEGKSFDEITRLAQVAESAGETDVITEEQNAAIALLQQIEALSQNQEAQQAQEEAGKQAEEKQKQQDAVDTEQTLKDLQNTPAKILRRKINGILSNNSPEKLENYPKAKKEATATATATATDPDITVLPIEPEVRDAEAKFTEDPDVGVFRSGEQFTVEESDALESVLELAQKGYPVRFTSSKRYGVPFTTAKIGDKADFLAKKIFNKYPLIKPEIKGKVQAGLRSVTRFDPETGTIKKGKVSWKVDNLGNGLFNNDPVVIAEMLAHNVRIPVPDSVNVFDINPSIKVKDGFVVDVIKPSDTGVGVVSAVNPVSAIENLKLDTSKVELATRIPFIEKTKDATVMPFGTREINERGFTQDVSDRQITYGDIKQQLDDFFNRASNTTEGDLKKPILGKSREAFGYDLLDETNAELAFTETYLQYRQLLHFFELKGAIESQLDKHIQAIGGQTKVKATRQSKNAIKKALMSRVGVESEAELAQILQPFITGSGKTHTDTIISFVEDNVLNNPDFDAGSMPTLDTVFKRNVKSYVAKEKVAGSLQRRNIEVSNTDLGLDQAETPFDDMYGQGDQGLAYAGSLGSVDPSDTLGDNAFYDTIKSVTENLISQIDESPELKEAITDLYIQALYPDATPRQRDLISKQKTSDMVSTLGTYLGTGSHTSRPEVLEFIKQLEDASLESGVDLKNGLYLSYLTYRYEGNPLENAEVVSEVRRLMSSSLGRNVSEADARNFIKAMDGAVRSRFSRSHVSEEVRAVFESMNMADVERLGLKDGDPESVISALQKIAESSDNESHKLVAQLLLEDEPFLRSVQFSLGSSPYPVAGQHNVLTDGSHVVYVNLKTGNGLGLENVLLEEYVHAFLADVASKPDSALNENQKLARQRLKGLYELAEKAYREGTYRSPIMDDAFENFDEFLAKFLLSPHLQAHVKGLKAPAGQRGFFSRIIDSLLSMFRKLTGREKSQYADALSDIIALSKTPVRTIVVPAKQVAAENAETAARAVDEVTEVLGAKPQQQEVTQETTQKKEEEQPDLQDKSAGEVINRIISDARKEGKLSSSEQRRFENLMYHLKSRVPVGVTVKTDTQMSAPAAAQGNVVYLNPKVLMQEVESFDSIGSKVYLETLLYHELAHVASFNALTVSEINELIQSLTDEEYLQIARTYYRLDTERDAAIKLLQTEVDENTDPELVREIAEQRLALAEEKLRMHLEKVMSGTTTEEDLDFWSSKPSLLRMITRYIRAAFAKMSAYRAMNGGTGTLDSLLRKVHNQAVLLNLGYNRAPISQSLDINDPTATLLEFARLTSVDPLDAVEEEQEKVERYARLFASRMPVDFQNRIMKRAGLRMVNGTDLVPDEDAGRQMSDFEVDFEWAPSQASNDSDLMERSEMAHGLITLARLKEILGLENVNSENDIISNLPDPDMAGSVQMAIDQAGDAKEAATIFLASTEDGFSLSGVDAMEEERSIHLSNAYATVANSLRAGLKDDDKVPINIGFIDDSSIDDVERMEFANAINDLRDGMYSVNITTLNEGNVDFYFESLPFRNESEMNKHLNESQGKRKKINTYDSPSGMNHDFLIGALEKLSTDRYDVKATIDDENYLNVQYISKEGQELAELKDTKLVRGGVIKVGYLENKTETDFNKSFSQDLMTVLIVYADEIGASKVVTQAAGDYSDFYKKTLRNTFNDALREVAATNKDINLERDLLPLPETLNGYVSWPKIGFKPDKGHEVDGALSRNSDKVNVGGEISFLLSQIRESRGYLLEALSKDQFNFIENKLAEQAKNIINRVIDNANYLKANIVKDEAGEADLFATIHRDPQRRHKAINAWRDSGDSLNVTFDLTDRSESLQAYTRVFEKPIVRTPEVLKLVSEFKTRSRRLVDEQKLQGALEAGDIDNTDARVIRRNRVNSLDSLKDEFNDRAHRELGLDFKLFASRGQTPTSTASNLDFSDVVQLLELPMTEFKAYKAPSGWLGRLFAGDVGAPIKNLLDQRDEFKRATIQMVKSFQSEFKNIIEKDKVDLNPATLKLIGEAQGYVDGNLVSDTFYSQKEAEHQARKQKIEADATLSKADKKVQISASKQQRKNEIEAAELAAIKAVEATRDRARMRLAAISPDLSTLIVKMRKELIQPMQNVLKNIGQAGTQTKDVNGLSDALRVRIDQTGGIYITRSFRMFNDPTFARKVREDKNYAPARQAAMDLFETQLKDQARQAARNSGMSAVDADLAADKALRDANRKAGGGRSYAENVLEAFISRYEGVVSGNPAVSNKYSKAIKNLTRRKDLPKALRDILGEYGEESGTDLIVRTMATVANLAAEYTFRANVATVGLKEGFLVDAKTAAASPDEYIEVKPTADQNDPLANLYAKKEVYDDIKDLITPPHSSVSNNTAAKAVAAAGNVFANLTGKAMLLKTLGSVGFYIRNILGNVLFFGPAQGISLYGSGKALYSSFAFSIDQWKTPDRLDAYLTELVGLGVFGDELRAGILRELLDGKTTPETMLDKLNQALEEAPVTGHVKKGLAWTEKKLTGLSASIDGAYKIAYYEHELDYLMRAKQAHPNSDIGQMSDYELKRMAAKKVKMTAQSLSQAPPIISQVSKSSYGMMFATFIRFKAETARIFTNTHRLSKEEKASDNPMIQARGRRRIRSMYTIIGGAGMAVPTALAYMAGIGEDEDEALRKSMPEYLQGHSFFYWRDGKSLLSFDLTYLNPFSLLSDPVLRSFESMMKGDFGDSVWKFIQGMIFDTYLDDQILAGSLMDVKENRDESTGRPIWIKEVDSMSEAVGKGLLYVLENAYEPRLLGDIMDAVDAAQGDPHRFSDTIAGELLDGVYPIKPHNVDPEKQFRRFLKDHQSRLREVTNAKFALYSDKPMGEDAVREVYRNELEGRRKLNNELFRVTRGFDKLGVNLNVQNQLMKQYGVGKDKARLIHFGVMDRPDVNKRFLDGLIERGFADRGAILLDERNKEARYLTLD